MLVYPNAKINLGLNVVEKRPDGYHNLETVFFPIGLADALEIVFPENETKEYIWQSSGNAVDCDPDQNLCIKALRKLREARELPTVGLHLHKVVPTGAGLGGGSSDAAFVMKHVNQLLKLGLSDTELKEMSAKIGADCPFFIDNKPSYATGIGDILTPIEVNLNGYWIVLVKPPVSVPTKTAYSKIRPHYPEVSIKEIIKKPVEEWKNLLVNDFEESVFAEYPQIEQLKTELYVKGAIYASMSGSGSSVFGIFKSEPNIEFAPEYFVWRGKL